MKIFVPTLGDPNRMHTYKLLASQMIPFNFVVYEWTSLPSTAQIVCDVPARPGDQRGWRLARKRRWIEENLVDPGEWYCMMDDNIRRVEGVKEPGFRKKLADWNLDELNDELSIQWCIRQIQDKCIEMGIPYGGAVYRSSGLFQQNRWSFGSQVSSKFCVCKRVDDLRWSEYSALEDFHRTVECIKKYGGVVRCNWIAHKSVQHESGGIGTFEERKMDVIRDARRLAMEYPDLVRLKSDGWPTFNRKGVNNARRTIRSSD